jgi:hypothetical protein
MAAPYSYVNNNPVSMVDPSGFKATSPCAMQGVCEGDFHQGPVAGDTDGPVFGDDDFGEDQFGPTSADLDGGYYSVFITSSPSTSTGANGTTGDGSNASDAASETASGATSATSAQDQGSAQSPDATAAQSPNSAQSANSPPPAEIVVTATQMSTAAGWTGVGAAIGEPLSGTWSVATNLGIYSAPVGNQYVRSLVRIDTVPNFMGAGAALVGTTADYIDGFESGSFGQANLNPGIAAAGILHPDFCSDLRDTWKYLFHTLNELPRRAGCL